MSFTVEGGKSSPLESPKGSRFTRWLDMTVFMIFAMDVFGPTTIFGVAPDGSNTIEKWFGRDKDRTVKYKFNGYKVRNPNEYSYSKENMPFYIVPEQRDTFMKESQIRQTDWRLNKQRDSLRKLNTANMLNAKYNL